MSLFTLFIHNGSLFRAFGFDLQARTFGVSSAKEALAKAWPSSLSSGTPHFSVPVDYLPIIVGLELFQLVLHPLDSLREYLES